MKIGVFCYHNATYKCVADVTMPVLSKYCKKHGYGLRISTSDPPGRDILWKLIPDLQEGLDHYDWAIHLNTDILITNHSISIESLLDRHLAITINLDHTLAWTLNDGFLAVKNSPEGKWLLEETWNMLGAKVPLGANPGNAAGKVTCALNALEILHRTNRRAHAMMHILPANACNSFLYTEYGLPETTPGHWQQGDLALHLPGRNNARRVELFTEWLPKIEW